MPHLKAAGLCGLPPFPFFKPAILLPFQVLSTTEIIQTVKDAETGEIVETNVETFQTVETIETVVTVETVGTMDAQGQDPSIPRRARSTAQRQCKSPLEVIGNSGGGPYAQTWTRNTRDHQLGRKVYIDGVDVTAPPKGDFPDPEPTVQPKVQPTAQPIVEFITQFDGQPAAERLSTFEKVKQQLRESARVLNAVFNKAQGKFTFKRVTIKQAQTPGKGKKKLAENGLLLPENDATMKDAQLLLNGGLDLAVPIVNSSFKATMGTISLRELGQYIHRKFSREPKVNTDMTPLPEQRPAVPDLEAHLTTRQVMGTEAWADNTLRVGNDGLPEDIRALTTSELLKLGGERIDNIVLVMQYNGPPNSPDLDATDKPMPTLDLDELNLNTDSLDDDFDPTSRAKRKDLVNYLGHARHASFHLVAGSASSYDAGSNISDYYGNGIQIVEPRAPKTLRVVTNHIEEPHVKTSEKGDGKDNEAVERKSAYSMRLSVDSMILDPEKNVLFPGRSYPPAQSLVLFLHGQGIRLVNIIKMLEQVDDEFIAEKKSQWFAGVKFPEQLEWSDDWVQKVGETCRAKLKEREMEQMLSGKVDKMRGRSHGLIKKTIKTKKLRKFVNQTVENHFFYRLRSGERKHPKLF
ncbi:uncharacterized protein PAC_09574 [Phialocephala subalpina]|uniref:Uncharacterized protein n=1 Tax=Phialocephala subalpina TaxID=576137 RepID=A0A1L7X3T4_9HELO|nr:uncharacterized protein PAC_09574 [Phialocephala subalpina]